jgi:hypothetical protein
LENTEKIMKLKALKYLATAFVLACLAACTSSPQLAQGSGDARQHPDLTRYEDQMGGGGG